MAATFDVQSLNIEGGRAEMLRQAESRRSCVAGAGESVCDSSVRERVGLLCSCTLIFRSDGLILLLDRELRRNVRWRGSDTGSWGCQGSRPQIIFLFVSGQLGGGPANGGVWRR